MIKRESQLQTLERFPKFKRWLRLQTGKTLYSIARRFKNIDTTAAFREWKDAFKITNPRFAMPAKRSGLRKSEYVELICSRLCLIESCVAQRNADSNDEICLLKSDDDIINFIIGVCDIHIDDHGQHDQLRYSNDEKVQKKLEGTPSRQKLWTQGMENQEVATVYFWIKFTRNASYRLL